MKLKFTLWALMGMMAVQLQAQSVDEIIDNYLEITGGKDKWRSLEGLQMEATLNQQGMEIPLTMIQLKDGRKLVKFQFQGKELVETAFDGELAWGHSFMNMEPEKKDSETTENLKREAKDFPDPWLDYKEKGYSAELLGTETIEGTECFKIKLTKTPLLVDGEEVENVAYYYFDTENFIPLVVESEIKSGQMKGMISQATMSDYQEVDGLYFPFSISQGIKDMGSQPLVIKSIKLNPQVEDSWFAFPEVPAGGEDKEGN